MRTHDESRALFLARLHDFLHAGILLVDAWDDHESRFNADDEFSAPVDSDGAPLFTLSLDDWLAEMQGHYDNALFEERRIL